ncbi:hypothetical protein CIT292_06810 [Citrobacter youngae ATCC 29220]|uniref:Uncharacterized protein n=1 Tax=Citrobacter youngae ATCC 29220 TaxID=500640 RepID=D4B8M7_9ENTR|nr:hypothetical protein CIT292_06810 [Citrobacter youngae ATCC 29220]
MGFSWEVNNYALTVLLLRLFCGVGNLICMFSKKHNLSDL